MATMHTPIVLNTITLANRLVMPPMATATSDNGYVTPDCLQYYDEKTKDGCIGLVIVEHCYVNKQGIAKKGQMSISRDSDIPALQSLVDVIHKNDVKVMAQINHAGSACDTEITGMPAISASAILNEKKNILPQEMSQSQINAVISDFADAAMRAKKAGFDGVEIHSAHGYLLNQFYSPITNKRTDSYTGATIEGRLKLHIQIIEAVRNAVGKNFLLAVRLGGCDYVKNGSTIEDSVKAAILFEKAGIDLLDISGGIYGYLQSELHGPGFFSDMTGAIKKEVSIPVVLTGGITDIESAELLIQENKADLIGVGRAILKDSDWAKNNMMIPNK